MQSRYETVFDFMEAGFPWAPIILGLVVVTITVVIYHMRDRLMTRRAEKTRLLLARIFVSVAILWTMTTAYRVFAQYFDLKNAVASGDMRVKQGQVTDYHSFLSTESGIYEKFCVQNYCFSYSDLVPSAGFNNMSAYGGPMEKDIFVRVHHTGNLIARLEIMMGEAK